VLRTIKANEQYLIDDDPVRPHIPFEQRVRNGRTVWILEGTDGTVRSVVCTALCDRVPQNEQDLDCVGEDVCVFYTVWSYDRGAGRDIIFGAQRAISERTPSVSRWVTLSPLTEMAERFHIRNGAHFVDRNELCQNFEYPAINNTQGEPV